MKNKILAVLFFIGFTAFSQTYTSNPFLYDWTRGAKFGGDVLLPSLSNGTDTIFLVLNAATGLVDSVSVGRLRGFINQSEQPITSNTTVLVADTTVLVANAGGNFTSLLSALAWSQRFNKDYVQALGQSPRVIIKIAQGFNMTAPTLINGGDYQNVTIKNNTVGKIDTVNYTSTSTTSNVAAFSFKNCNPPSIDSLHLIMDVSAVPIDVRVYGIDLEKTTSWFKSTQVFVENFDRGVSTNQANIDLRFFTVIKCLDFDDRGSYSNTFGIRLINNKSQLLGVNIALSGAGIYAEEGAVVRIVDSATQVRSFLTSNDGGGVVGRGAFISIYDGDFRIDGSTSGTSDIKLANNGGNKTPSVINLNIGVEGGTSFTPNQISSAGIIFKADAIVPTITQSGTTAQRPASPAAGQLYFDSTLDPKQLILYNGTAWVNTEVVNTEVVNVIISDGDSLHDNNVNARLYFYGDEDAAITISCAVSTDSLEAVWFVYNYSLFELTITPTVCNTLNNTQALLLVIPPGKAALIRKSRVQEYLSLPDAY